MNRSDATRRELVSAAERLFSEQGIEVPSLREITRVAGQRNTSALQYHFRDRDELLRAVLDKHGREVDARRNALLDEGADPAAALVVPLADELDDCPDYLQIAGEVVARARRFADSLDYLTRSPSLRRWSKEVEPLLPKEAVGRPLHRRFVAIRVTHAELAGRARERRLRDHRLFTSHLVDVLAAVLAAPVSDRTRSLIRKET